MLMIKENPTIFAWKNNLQIILSIFLPIYLITLVLFPIVKPMTHMGMAFIVVIFYMVLRNPLQIKRIPSVLSIIIDACFILAAIVSIGYIIIYHEQIIWRLGSPTSLDLTIAIMGTIVSFETCRRTKNIPLMILAIIFVLYALYGYIIPGTFGHAGFTISRVVRYVWLSSEGVFSSFTMLVVRLLFVFIFWGTLLHVFGVSKFFLRIAFLLTQKIRSGPALAGVVGSSLLGTIVGNAVANVVTTGPITIPLMKNRGISSEKAAAIEAASSTGGQILPPVMGIAAFAMAQMSGIPYINIMLAAIIPAFLYYWCLAAGVHLESLKVFAKVKSNNNINNRLSWGKEFKDPDFIKGFAFFVPIIILVYLIVSGLSLPRSGVYTIFSTIAIYFILYPYPKQILIKLVEASRQTINNMLILFGAAAGVGILIGAITMTGIHAKVSEYVLFLANESIILTLLFVAFASIILGMGMPTVAAYIIVALILVPALIKLGIPELTAHFFAFFYAVLSAITPPVAIASFAAASIAETNPYKVSLYAMLYAKVAILIPFIFVFNPAVLGQGSLGETVFTILTLLIGFTSITIAISGFITRKLLTISRLLLLMAGLLIITPGPDLLYKIIGGLIGIIVTCMLELMFDRVETKTALGK